MTWSIFRKNVSAGRSVTVSFLNVTGLTAAFLNAAIGQLYGSFAEEQIRSPLKVQDMQPDDHRIAARADCAPGVAGAAPEGRGRVALASVSRWGQE